MQSIRFFFKKTSIRKKLIISISCVAILMAFYSIGVSYWLTTTKVDDMSRRLSENNLHSAGKMVENYLNLFENYTTQIVRIPELQTVNQSTSYKMIESVTNIAMIHTTVRTYLSMAESDGIKFGECSIYFKNGFAYTLNDRQNPYYDDYDSCLRYFQAEGLDNSQYSQATWISNTNLIDENGEKKVGLVNVRFFYNPVNMEKTGIIVSTIFEENLCDVYSGFASNAFIISRKGVIISSTEKKKIATLYSDENIRSLILASNGTGTSVNVRNWYQSPKMVSFSTIMNNDAYLVVPFDFYTVLTQKEMWEYFRSSLIPMTLGVIIVFFLAYLFSNRLSKSIVTLTTFVKNIDQGDSNGRIHLEGNDEVTYLGEKINDMLNRIQESEQSHEQDLKAKQVLELQLLQSQINPHLLYNTLDSMFWSLKKKNTENAEMLLISLSEFFKGSLAQGRMETSLGEELQLIQNYLVIQRLARDKKFVLINAIPPDFLYHPIVKLSLQPIVENAIIHGFEGYRDDGIIQIHAKRDNDSIIITVEDNGIGMLPPEVNNLNQMLHTYPPPQEMRSYGLYNINRRITQAYGNEFGIMISSQVSVHTTIIMTIPFFENEKPDDI